MCYLVPGPLPCPEVVAVFYIRPAEVLTLFSVGGDAQVERQNTVVGFLTPGVKAKFCFSKVGVEADLREKGPSEWMAPSTLRVGTPQTYPLLPRDNVALPQDVSGVLLIRESICQRNIASDRERKVAGRNGWSDLD